MNKLSCIILYCTILCMATGVAQSQPPVIWSFRANDAKVDRAVLHITARIAPGWHLYSQEMEEGGPIPTRFTYTPSDDYALQGRTLEKGTSESFFDEVYETQVTWYTHAVEFIQVIRLHQPRTTVRGVVQYMACNKELCIPGEEEFAISISP